MRINLTEPILIMNIDKRFRNIVLSLIGLLGSFTSYSQSDPMYTQYYFNMQTINPAYAGTWQTMGFMALTRLQWLGVQGHPKTQTFSVQAPFRTENMGLGMNIVNDKIGLERRLFVNLDYSYRLTIKENTFLRFGIKGGFTNYSNPLPFYKTYDPNDPNYMLEIKNRFMPNVGVGAFLSNTHSYFGLSVPKLIEAKFNNTSNDNYTVTDYRQIYASGGWVFDLSGDVKFKPTVLAKIVEGAPLQCDLSANILLKEKFWLGTMYRSGDAVGVMAQWIFQNNFRIGYTIDFTTSTIRKYHKGVHEIMVSYEIKWNDDILPRYF